MIRRRLKSAWRPLAVDVKLTKKKAADRRRGVGRSRGGLNIKVHAAVDAAGHLAERPLSPGQDGDGPHGRELLGVFQPEQMAHLLGDAAYDGDETREALKKLRAKECIKPSQCRTNRKRYDKQRYRNRNQVERFFNRIKHCRRVATRYEMTMEYYAGFIQLAALFVNVFGMSTHPTECDSPVILLLSTDLIFAGRFRSAAVAVEVGAVLSAEQALARVAAGGVRAVCIDLELPGLELSSVVTGLRQRGVVVVAYGPHVQTARLDAARAAGCDAVLSRGAFDRNLPELLTALSAGRLP